MLNYIPLKKSSIFLLLIIVSFLLSFLFSLILPLHRDIDLLTGKAFMHLRYGLKGSEEISSDLCIFNIDDKDIRQLSIKPYDRKIFSEVLAILSYGKAKTVIFDFLFESEVDPGEDSEFARNSAEADFLFTSLSLSGFEEMSGNEELFKKIILVPKVVKAGSPYTADFFTPPFRELAEAVKGLGTTALRPDNDAISRRLPLLFSYKNRNEYIPSLVLIGICHFFQADPQDIEVTFGSRIRIRDCTLPGGTKRDYFIPIDKKGNMIINYSGPWQDSTENYSVRDLFKMYKKDPALVEDILKNTLVVVSDISSGKKDYSRGIFDTHYPNSGIISNALNTILTENYLVEPGPFFIFLSTLFFMIFIWLTAFFFRNFPNRIILITLLLFIVYFIIEAVLFIRFNRLPRFSLILGGTLLSLLAIVLYKINEKSEDLEQGTKLNEPACLKYDITPAQQKLLVEWQKGLTYKKVAANLKITESTVKKQVSLIKEKTGKYQKKDIMEIFFPQPDKDKDRDK